MQAFNLNTSEMFFEHSHFYTQLVGFKDETYHNHTFFEIFYVISGESNHILNDEKAPLNTGSFYILRPDDSHGFLEEGTSTNFLHRDILLTIPFFKKVCDFLMDSLYDEIFNAKQPFNITLSSEQIDFFETILTKIQLEDIKPSLYNALINDLTIHLLMLAVNQKIEINTNWPSWVHQLISIFKTPSNLCEPLPFLIQRISYDKAYMCRVFKSCTGMTMTEYLRNQRLAYAIGLLKTTDFSIQTIANLVGYNNISHFYHEFKDKYDTSPKSIRNKLKSEVKNNKTS